MAFNLDAFKAQWRALAEAHGVDPVNGATSFQAANIAGDARKRTHQARQRVAAYNNAAKPDAWRRYDNGQGEVDMMKVERQARRDWWAYSDYWVGGGRRITMLRPSWTQQRERTSDGRYLRVVLSLDDEQVETVVSRIPPPDYEAVKNLRRAALYHERRRELPTRSDDKRAMLREVLGEIKAATPRQMRMEFAYA